MFGLTVDYVWTWLKWKLRKKRKFRFPNGIPRVPTLGDELSMALAAYASGLLTKEQHIEELNRITKRHRGADIET